MNEQKIWDFFMNEFKNPVGVAALMGNLYVESKLNPALLQSSYARKFNTSSEEYTAAVDATKTKTPSAFVTDGAGYGLAQWTYHSRKEALLKHSIEKNTSIGDLDMQLSFIRKEIASYKTVVAALKDGTDVRAVSDIVAKRYEKPADTSEFALANRGYYSQNFYDQFSGSTMVKVRAVKNVNIRTGNGMKYGRVGALKQGQTAPWVATSENNWHAIEYGDKVCWVSGEFAEVINKQ